MCGIIGLAQSKADRTTGGKLAQAVHSLRHRGPDANGTYAVAPFFLGHTRLSIQDLSDAGSQPMISANKNFVMVYNGEIYNADEVRQDLVKRGVRFRGRSDSEVLIEGYAAFGADILERLNGIYAFAILDIANKRLFAARDPMGVKPLYYTAGQQGFAFASEIRALQHLVNFDRTLDPLAAMRYATFMWSPGTRTMFRDVKKLEAGKALIVENGKITRHYRFADLPRYVPNYSRSFDDCKRELSQQVEQAVQRQLLSDAPLGCFLSGGVDSTAIVAYARKYMRDVPCFTMRVSGTKNAEIADDLPYAKLAAKALNVKLHEISIEPRDLVNGIESMVDTLEEPNADPACLNLGFIANAARQQGIKVLLSGTGGDDLFSGYRRHALMGFDQLIDRFPAGVRSGLGRLGQSQFLSGTATRKFSKLLKGIDKPDDERLIDLFAWVDPQVAAGLFSRDFLAQIDDPQEDLASPIRAEVAAFPNDPKLEKCLRLEQKFFLADHNLLYTDKMGMAAGVEIRVPLLDLELMKFAASIPAEWKMRGLSPKWIFRKSLEGVVPKSILRRRKTGFGVPLREWMNGPLRDFTNDILSPARIRKRGIFNPENLQRLSEMSSAGKIDASFTLLALVCIELWIQKFSDIRAPNH